MAAGRLFVDDSFQFALHQFGKFVSEQRQAGAGTLPLVHVDPGFGQGHGLLQVGREAAKFGVNLG